MLDGEPIEKITHKEKNDLWKIVENIVIENYSRIKVITMRNSFYLIREILSGMLGEIVSKKQYKYFSLKYDYYQADKWPVWERKHNIRRPICKDPTLVLYNGETISLAYLDKDKFLFRRCQGFMFLEKSGFINDLELLSRNGWVVLAGQGHSSRELREQMAHSYPSKPILVVHDFDYAGQGMTKVFEEGSSRTRHLNLTFKNVVDLGLREEDVIELDLPIEPEAEKYIDKQEWRVELNALTVLIERTNIKNPLLWYVTKRMREEGIPLHREEQSSIEALRWGILLRVQREFESIIEKVTNNLLQDVLDEEIIELALPDETGENLDQFQGIIFDMAEHFLDGAEYIDAEEIVSDILNETEVEPDGKKFVRRTPQFIDN